MATGLSVAKPFSLTGHYSADDLLNLYTVRASEIFSPPSGVFGKIKKYKYSYGSEGITRVVKEYFSDSRIINCTTDLLVTSVETSDLYNTFTFTTQKAKMDYSFNYTLVDVVRATSAAPTFFPVHKIGDRYFVDGGVRSNNPSSLAYDYAVTKTKETGQDIMMLSLGTGEYIPEPIKPTAYNGLLFWAKNIVDLTTAGQEYNTHLQVQKYFTGGKPNRYFRFQAKLEEVIPLDEQRPEKLKDLTDLAHETLEEAYADEDNRMNKLIESLTI